MKTIKDVFTPGSRMPEDFDRMRKVCAIQDVAKLLALLDIKPLTDSAFDKLYDGSYTSILEFQTKLENEVGRRVAKNGGPELSENSVFEVNIAKSPDNAPIKASELHPMRLGDWVTWQGTWGKDAPERCRICRIEHIKMSQTFDSVPFSDKDKFIFILSNGHWAYGWQIEPLL